MLHIPDHLLQFRIGVMDLHQELVLLLRLFGDEIDLLWADLGIERLVSSADGQFERFDDGVQLRFGRGLQKLDRLIGKTDDPVEFGPEIRLRLP